MSSAGNNNRSTIKAIIMAIAVNVPISLVILNEEYMSTLVLGQDMHRVVD